MLTYQNVKIQLVNNDNNLFCELSREGYKEGFQLNAQEEILDGKPKGVYYFGKGCVAYEGDTALKVV